jgi:hypothetical protein
LKPELGAARTEGRTAKNAKFAKARREHPQISQITQIHVPEATDGPTTDGKQVRMSIDRLSSEGEEFAGAARKGGD